MKHVLVVEDDPHNAILFRKLLEKRIECRVTVSESPTEILALAYAREVDLVVMDVSLANSRIDGKAVNGVDLCRLIKNDPRSASIPVLIATAHAMRGDAESLVAESGADDYVAKPIVSNEDFLRQVRGLLGEAAA